MFFFFQAPQAPRGYCSHTSNSHLQRQSPASNHNFGELNYILSYRRDLVPCAVQDISLGTFYFGVCVLTIHLVTGSITAFLLFFLLANKKEWTLGQRIRCIHLVVANLTFPSVTRWTLLRTLGIWVGCVAYDHVAVNKHKRIGTNEFSGFKTKPLQVDRGIRMVDHGGIIWTSKKKNSRL